MDRQESRRTEICLQDLPVHSYVRPSIHPLSFSAVSQWTTSLDFISPGSVVSFRVAHDVGSQQGSCGHVSTSSLDREAAQVRGDRSSQRQWLDTGVLEKQCQAGPVPGANSDASFSF